MCQCPRTDSTKAQIAIIMFCDELTTEGSHGWLLCNQLSYFNEFGNYIKCEVSSCLGLLEHHLHTSIIVINY